MSIKKNALCVVLSTVVTVSIAAEKADDKSPLGCKNVGYNYELKTLELHPAEAGDMRSSSLSICIKC